MQKTKGETAWGAEMQSCREIKMSERRKMREKENELSDAQRNWTSSILLKSSLVQYVLFMSSSAAPYHAGWLGAFLAGWIMTGWADETLTGWTTWLTGWCVVHDRRLVPASRSLVLIKRLCVNHILHLHRQLFKVCSCENITLPLPDQAINQI